MIKAIAIDTNVLIRLFVQDDSHQKQITAVKNLLKDKSEVYITQTVQLELVWVLESSYQFDKEQVIFALETLANHSVFILENPNQFNTALSLFKNNNADFSDYLIFANSQENNYPFWTFDKKLSKINGVNRLT